LVLDKPLANGLYEENCVALWLNLEMKTLLPTIRGSVFSLAVPFLLVCAILHSASPETLLAGLHMGDICRFWNCAIKQIFDKNMLAGMSEISAINILYSPAYGTAVICLLAYTNTTPAFI
jgi:hypothetical protein